MFVTFSELFAFQDEMVKTQVPLQIEGLRLKAGTGIHRDLFTLNDVRVASLVHQSFEVRLENQFYVILRHTSENYKGL